MSISERPGIYTSYEVSGVVRASAGGNAVGLAAAAESGSAGTVVTVADYGAALSAFGGGNLAELVRILLENGAPEIHCCRVADGDYDTAFAALMAEAGPRFMVCDSHSAAVHAKLLSAIGGADEKSKYRIGVVECGESSREALVDAAAELNSERMALVSHFVEDGTPGAVAAAVCGVMAAETDPAAPFNGAVLRGLDNIGANFSDGDLNLLVRGGVLPLETAGGGISIVRGVSTRTTTGGAPDATWREINTILIVDEVIPSIRDRLRANFSRAKNNAQTRGAIRTRVVIELENYLAREIIDGYDNVTAAASEDDPTVCVVSFGFSVAHGLNIIRLSAVITV
ncbi:MAG: phage tail sheath protein [Oscillospiraceae bacterium]|nr:phage tail sheath protein [Oscillospiraceae bacterium]